MKTLGSASTSEVLLTFMRAEVDSPRFGSAYRALIDRSGFSLEQLVTHADLNNAQHNLVRANILLNLRGFGGDALLFKGFPADVQWQRAQINLAELDQLWYARHANWVSLTRGTRRVLDAPARLDDTPTPDHVAQHIHAVANRLRTGEYLGELVVVGTGDGRWVLLEGHTRATAMALVRPAGPINALVGTSPTMAQWLFYGLEPLAPA
jgi:hypothetical protein